MKRIARLWRVFTAGLLLGSSAASAQSALTLSLAPHHSGFRDVSQGSAVASYTTPAYVSLDQPHSATLFYASGQARPTVFIQVDATDNAGSPPVRMSLKVRRGEAWGTWETFTNGLTELFFQAGSGPNRLAGQIDAAHLLPRAYGYIAEVTVWRQDNSTETRQISLRAPVVNERDNPFGFGWSMPGLMRLYDQGDGVYITQGDGTGLWFHKNAAGGYDAPEGDFSQVTWNGAGWMRRYPDGTEAEFGWSGYLDFVRDRFGNRTWYGYDTSVTPHRLSFIEDPIGKRINFGYSGGGLAWIQDPGGRTVNTSTGGPGGRYLYRFWDPDGVLGLDLGFHTILEELQTVWPRGADQNVAGTGWEYAYDTETRRHLVSVAAPQVNTTDVGLTRPTTTLRSLEQAVLPAPGTGTSASPAARVIPATARVEIMDPKGNTTKMTADRFGLPTWIEEPLGRITTIERNANGQVTRSVAPLGPRGAQHLGRDEADADGG
jgi:hypothetical protein